MLHLSCWGWRLQRAGERALVVSFGSAPGVPNWGGLLPRIRTASAHPAHQAFDILYVVDPERAWYNGARPSRPPAAHAPCPHTALPLKTRGGLLRAVWARRQAPFLPPSSCCTRPCKGGRRSAAAPHVPVHVNPYQSPWGHPYQKWLVPEASCPVRQEVSNISVIILNNKQIITNNNNNNENSNANNNDNTNK